MKGFREGAREAQARKSKGPALSVAAPQENKEDERTRLTVSVGEKKQTSRWLVTLFAILGTISGIACGYSVNHLHATNDMDPLRLWGFSNFWLVFFSKNLKLVAIYAGIAVLVGIVTSIVVPN